MSLLTSAPTIVQKKIYSLAAGNFRTLRGMKSMTGYGRGECARDGFKITVELGAVNRRQSEISVNLPRELELLEAQVRDAINAQVARQVHGNFRLPAVDRAQLDGDLETVPRAFAATVTRHGFHPAQCAKIPRRKRINFLLNNRRRRREEAHFK